MATDNSNVELRGMAPRITADLLDAISMRRRISRWELVLEVLNQYADDKLQEAVAITRICRSNEEGAK